MLKPLEVLNTIILRNRDIETPQGEYADVAWFNPDTNEIVVRRHKVVFEKPEKTTQKNLKKVVGV